MKRRLAPVLALAMTGGTPAGAQDPAELPVLEAFVDGAVQERDIVVRLDEIGRAPPVLWRDEISVLGAEYIRLHIASQGAPFPAGAELRLIPPQGGDQRIDLAALDPEGTWSGVLMGARATLAIVSPEPAPGTALAIDRIVVQQPPGQLYSTWGETNDIVPVHHPDAPAAVDTVAPSVAFLAFIEGGKSRVCTGFLVAPDLMLTNQHCIHSDETCSTMTAIFGYEQDRNGGLSIGPQARCAGFDPARSDFVTDVTAVRLDRGPGAAYPPVTFAPDLPEPPEGPLFIVQHPGSVPKQVAFVECGWRAWPAAGRGADTDFTHTCDTARGSSGAPVFDLQGRLVGVHHFGFRDDDSDIWTENRGVRLGAVGAWLSLDPVPPVE